MGASYGLEVLLFNFNGFFCSFLKVGWGFCFGSTVSPAAMGT